MSETALDLNATAECLHQQAWDTLSSKVKKAGDYPTVVIIEVTPAGPRALYRLHNIDGTGLPVAERRAAALIDKTGRAFEVRTFGATA